MFYILVARKPEKVDHIDAAGCIGDVIRAYTALHYQARVCGGETVLIFNGASVSMCTRTHHDVPCIFCADCIQLFQLTL